MHDFSTGLYVRINGEYVKKKRRANKKYFELDDLDQLFEDLQKESRDEYAKRKGIPYNSVNHMVQTYFPKEWLAKIKVKRIHI